MKFKKLNAIVDAVSEKGIVAKITTESIDRDGEVLVPQGMNSKEFENNPVMFWNHDYANPVGKVVNLKRDKDSVYGTLEFAKRPEDFQGEFFPAFAEAMVKQGIVRGVSVGFIPEEGGMRVANKSDRSKYGANVKRVFNRWKLLEVSLAPLPANQNALIAAMDKGMLSPILVKQYLGFDLEAKKVKQTRRRKYILSLSDSSEEQRMTDLQEAVRAEVARARGQIYL